MSYRHHRQECLSSQPEFCLVSTELKKLEDFIRSVIVPGGDSDEIIDRSQVALELQRTRDRHIPRCATCLRAETRKHIEISQIRLVREDRRG
jgi:hypothetical protein